jgi:ubiquinone biosynthesis protein COQ4
MAEPLEAARRRLGITPATLYEAIPHEARDFAVPSADAADVAQAA